MRIVEVAFSGTIGTREMGPVSTVICELSNRFANRGHQVTVVDVGTKSPRSLLDPAIGLVECSAVPESLVESLKENRVRKFLRRWHNCTSYVRQLESKLDLYKPEVVHFHSPGPAFIAQRLHRIGAFYTAHTPLWSLEQSPSLSDASRSPVGRRGMLGNLDTWVERAVVSRSKLTVGLGNYLAVAMPKENVVTIPSGLDLNGWNPIDRISARKTLNIGTQDFVAVFAGRIKHVKGVDILLDAVKLLARSLPSLKVFIIGPFSGSFDTRDQNTEPYAREMLARAKGLPVRFLAFISNQDLEFKQYLAAADIFVLPSRAEPQGLVALESLAMGTPVIAAATGGIPDMVSKDVGYLFAPGDAAALAARIREAHDDPQALSHMRRASRSRVQLCFSWDDVADRYLASFNHVLSRAGIAYSPGAIASVLSH